MASLERSLSKVAIKQNQRRADLTRRIAEHLLSNGFRDNSIRALADAVGTSDRMLIYYFDSKERLIEEVLALLSSEFSAVLETLGGSGNLGADELLDRLSRHMYSRQMRPLLNLWFEITGLALRGEQPYKNVAKQTMLDWEEWIRRMLKPQQADRASDLLALLEGRIMIRLVTGSGES